MAKSTSLSKILSLSNVLTTSDPRERAKDALVKLLRKRCKELGIVWNPRSFSDGLENPDVPVWLLEKLEALVSTAELSRWRISESLKIELDETIEDIESFNPEFVAELEKLNKEARDENSWVSSKEIKRSLETKIK